MTRFMVFVVVMAFAVTFGLTISKASTSTLSEYLSDRGIQHIYEYNRLGKAPSRLKLLLVGDQTNQWRDTDWCSTLLEFDPKLSTVIVKRFESNWKLISVDTQTCL